MKRYFEIVVNVPQIKDVFHYHLPEDASREVKPGQLVEVPFGAQTVQGVVLQEVTVPAVPVTRPIGAVIDPDVIIPPHLLELARLVSEKFLASITVCIGLMLPPGLGRYADMNYELTDRGNQLKEKQASPAQSRFIDLLKARGTLRGNQIERIFKHRNWRSTAQAMVRRGWINASLTLPPPGVRPKTIRTVQLACPPAVALRRLDASKNKKSNAFHRREQIIQCLIREAGVVDVSWIYTQTGGNSSDIRKLADSGLVLLGESQLWRDPLKNMLAVPAESPVLTADQMRVWEQIHQAINACATGASRTPFLLRGVTSSGKTEIYLKAVEETIRIGRQALVLVPEIALTPQTTQRFHSRFPGQVGLVHSQLSVGERYDTWRRAGAGDIPIVIGPRSALFIPLLDPGLIVLDECHDDSYYQSTGLPYYDARTVAMDLARIKNAVCVFGSATPDVTQTYQAHRGAWKSVELPTRILAHRDVLHAQIAKYGIPSRFKPFEKNADSIDLPPVQIVDMRKELKSGNHSIFSRALQKELEHVFHEGQQAILFLNRRGTNTYVFCRDCGYSIRCPRCELPLTYHLSKGGFSCHHCGYQRKLPAICPSCKSKRIRHYGTGTEKVEAELSNHFPEIKSIRWDWETTRRKGAHQDILTEFANRKAQILIGTQMLAKGLDLPLVTLVGMILADVGLNLPDYRSNERNFQVLTQVAGRAGRSPLGGRVILQTFQPEHYVIQAASMHDYSGFYDQEIRYRRKMGYPPFAKLIRLEYRHPDAEHVEATVLAYREILLKKIQEKPACGVEMIGPAPCFFNRIAGETRWHIILRGPDPIVLLDNIKMKDWRIQVNPPSLL